jgi:hypothetical protein
MEKYRVLQVAGADTKSSARSDAVLMAEAHSAGFDAVRTLR